MGMSIRELRDLCMIISSHLPRTPNLQVLNFPNGMRIAVEKLPPTIINRGRKHGTKYERQHNECHPPFSVFVEFLDELTAEYGNASYHYRAAAAPLVPRPV